jgi:hypothetical protein
MEHSPSSEANSSPDSQEILPFNGTGRFIILFIRARQWSLY